MVRRILAISSLFLPLSYAEEAPSPGATGKWCSVLEKEVQTIRQRDTDSEQGYGQLHQAVAEAEAAASKLRAAQIAFGDECIYLYADMYRPEQDVIENMRATFARRVDECLLQDLRSIVTLCPWCRTGDKNGFWLRTPADAALWLTDITPRQARPVTGLFAARNHRDDSLQSLARVSGISCNIQKNTVELCAKELAGLYGEDFHFDPVSGVQQSGGSVLAKDIQAIRAAFETAEQAWADYCKAVAALVFPHPAFDEPGPFRNTYIERVQERLYASHMQYLTFVSNGVQSDLKLTPKNGAFHVDAGQQRYPFGEIFHDYAMFFRHPAMPGNPWCMTMGGPSSPDAVFSYVPVAPCKELDDYAATHPDGGMVFVHGYVDVEVTGKPYEPVNRPAGKDGKIPDSRPVDAYNVRAVLRVISLMPLKW